MTNVTEIKQSINNVTVVGTLVKSTLEERMKNDKEFINGSLVLRTDDGSEHQVDYYASKFTKEGKESALYKGLVTIMEQAVSLEKAETPNEADVIKIGGGEFSVNDFKSPKDGTVATALKISAKFANRLTQQEKETTPKVATFEVAGIVHKLDQEMIKAEPTGNGLVVLNAIGYGGKIIPIKLIVKAEMVDAFGTAGFYEGGSAKFNGTIINTTTTEEVVEKQAFGEDLVKTVSRTKKLNEIMGGSPLESIGITDEQYQACLSKRRLHMEEVAQGGTKAPENAFTPAPTQAQNTAPNPFQAKANPFAK